MQTTLDMTIDTLTSGPAHFRYAPSHGGRILSFGIDGYEFLTGKEIHPENFGSTFWSSPQSFWSWPPPPALDSDPYEIIPCGESTCIRSAKDPITGFQFKKNFSAAKNGGIGLSYSIMNTTGEARKAAPWEISRVHKGGLLIFPVGKEPIGKKHFDPVQVDIIDGICWYQDTMCRPPLNRLSIADGSEGWMAYAIDGRVFIKTFRDTPSEQQAPGEAEILVYVSSEADYIEIEIQGSYETLQPGEESVWDVRWTGTALPKGVVAARGNRELVEFIRTQASL